MKADIVVVGGGLVGAAIGYGLTRRKLRVLVLDGGDRDLRASSTNAGLVWLHGKGMGMPAYQHLTSTSLDLWPNFSDELTEATGIDLQYEHNGGLVPCLSETEFEKRHEELRRLHNQPGSPDADWEMLDRSSLAKLLPKVTLGQDVVGASFGRRDGHTNPFHLLTALHAEILRNGGQLWGAKAVTAIQAHRDGSFNIEFGTECVSAARVVIAAGLGSKALGAQVGLDIPIRPQRGQMLITERLEPFLPLPLLAIRQTQEGTVSIGTTNEEVGFDTSTNVETVAEMSANAIRQIPALKNVRLVREWAGLRILTPDGYPIYAESEKCPGAFVAVCHSGVTLAAAHATVLADAIAAGELSPLLQTFHQRRFDVPKAA